VGYEGNIISFEPDPDSYAALATSASRDPRWVAHAFAIGAADGSAVLQRYDSSDWNSLRHVDEAGLARRGRSIALVGTVDCEVRRLDSVLPDDRWYSHDVFLKSDTQGNELAVLVGAAGVANDIAGVMLEISLQTMYAGEACAADVLDATNELGFRPTGFFPVTRSKGSLALDTVDVCFVRGR
jgi:FkbM family methyltransferase